MKIVPISLLLNKLCNCLAIEAAPTTGCKLSSLKIETDDISVAADNGCFINQSGVADGCQTRALSYTSLRSTPRPPSRRPASLLLSAASFPRPARSIPEPAPLTCAPRASLQIFTLWEQIITSFICFAYGTMECNVKMY